jgi:hypothetical protein
VSERDPKVSPEFGDVFRWHWEGKPGDPLIVMFVTGGFTYWTALDIATGGLTDGYIGVADQGWEFIEHIDGREAGGMPEDYADHGALWAARSSWFIGEDGIGHFVVPKDHGS